MLENRPNGRTMNDLQSRDPKDYLTMGIYEPYYSTYWLALYHIVNVYKNQRKMRMRVEVVTQHSQKLVGEYSGFTLTLDGENYVMDYDSFDTHCKFD